MRITFEKSRKHKDFSTGPVFRLKEFAAIEHRIFFSPRAAVSWALRLEIGGIALEEDRVCRCCGIRCHAPGNETCLLVWHHGISLERCLGTKAPNIGWLIFSVPRNGNCVWAVSASE